MSVTVEAICVREYAVGDLEGVVSLWNQVLVRDGISERVFMEKVLADWNFDPAGCYVAVDQTSGGVIGFMLGIVRLNPLEGIGMQEDLGWITSFFVDPVYERMGIGSRLLKEVMGYMQRMNRRLVNVSTYVPNYFIAGVDIDAYASGWAFLKKHGFEKREGGDVVGMGNELQDMVIPEKVKEQVKELAAEGIELKMFEDKYAFSLLDFLRKEFAGDWASVIVDKIKKGTDDEIIVATKDEEVLGYVQWNGSHFGPFGVSEKLRGKGIGSILFWQVVEQMKKAGEHFIWLGWTGGAAARFYAEKGGLHEVRRHEVMVKEM
ncbi:Acetyltransferase (GNAT) family protein [Poriferisphaera corsica]|uniref:Acetyltransferase (GNAT) family protein n=1 Tax=Poriferisphaera corsica TaxID=2528020 RepID=A0A517YRB8_9BACT|nr:GNAT family N-acetyltransferase [Poriferisphaera corsica]QDU32767.1 Acetyltransferase (GNAT) family protein [Poriferisphaera corsica]